jgi:hypothetical protein
LSVLHAGAGGLRPCRYVDNPHAPSGSRHKAEQGSGPYVRHLLEHDPAWAQALSAEPAVRTGIAEHLKTHGLDGIALRRLDVSTEGRLSLAEHRITADSFGPQPVRLAAG